MSEEEKPCRLRWGNEDDGPLFQPCASGRGSAQWIHEHCLATELKAQGKYDEAEALCRKALEVALETHGNRHPRTLISISSLGLLLHAKGDLAAAEPLCREALEARRKTLSDRHPDTLTSINNLGMLLQAKGDLAAAVPLCREALEARRETLGNRHPDTLSSINNLGGLLKAKGDLAAKKMTVASLKHDVEVPTASSCFLCICRLT